MDISKSIYAKEYSLNDILSGKKYTVDYFQREYKWQQENIEQLIQDLTNAFLDNYKVGDTTEDVANYDVYYLGSIVLSDKKTTVSIIDCGLLVAQDDGATRRPQSASLTASSASPR